MTDYLSVQQAAELANLSDKTIRRAIAAGDLEAFRVGRAIRLRTPDVQAWVEADPVRPSLVPGLERQPRPRRLPTTASAVSVARMRDQDQHEAA